MTDDFDAASTPVPHTLIGDFAIVELFGHQTLVGRIAEIERFGSKMLAIEPLHAGELRPVVYHGGDAIYRLTPCSAEVAWRRQSVSSWQLPPSIAATLPAALLDAPAPRDTYDNDDDELVF